MTRACTLVVTVLAVGFSGPSIRADDRQVVTVSFGAGLNTGGAANHHIMPQEIRVRKGGVVNFLVAGFHQIMVYNPGQTPEDISEFIAANPPVAGVPFINKLNVPLGPIDLRYTGINPASNATTLAGANPATPPNPVTRSNLGNRVESVAFLEPGRYLVICNVRGHFLDGMFAWVRVDDDDDQ
jgi:hypothetical protein